MCGLTGFWQPHGLAAEEARAISQRMADALVHRGPDDAGVWVDAAAGLTLGHRRLAILDLSPAGHQPMMVSVGGRPFTVINVSQVTGKISVPKTKNSGENNV